MTQQQKHDPELRDTPRTTFFARLGPGLVTGASDDDPSGIGTYSQAGAQYGCGLLWTMVVSLPLMIAIQEISARIGRVTGRGIASNIRRCYPAWVLYPVVLVLVVANTINLGADIGAMGDAASLLMGGPALLYSALLAVLCLVLQAFASYSRCARVLKWLTLVLFCYVGTVFCVHMQWHAVLRGMVLPDIHLDAAYLSMFIAILGTTISPYLFFWQAAQETEEIKACEYEQRLTAAPRQARASFWRIRVDTWIGMTFSNVVAMCIILCAAVTLNAHGVKDIETSAQAAEALRPLGGRLTFTIFTLGILGTGMLAVPVLASSAAYAVGEAFKWPTGLDRKPRQARGFYAVLTIATLVGLAINLPFVQRITHLGPIKALFWAAVINGVSAVPIMVVMMLMCQNKSIMGQFSRISKPLRLMGWLATAVMAAAAVGMFVTLNH